MSAIEEIVGPAYRSSLVDSLNSPYTICGVVQQPGVVPPPDILREELMRLQELVFRQDLLELDRRVRVIFVTPAGEAYRFRRVFDKRAWDGIDILNLGDLGLGRGLASVDWLQRTRYVQGLAQLMMDWHPPLPRRLHGPAFTNEMSASYFCWFERQVAAFYVRVLWHQLHRVAVGPPRRAGTS
ncbi:hypothetical protein HDZ31DRAFT_70794 [Schizophyllum fasciatum]